MSDLGRLRSITPFLSYQVPAMSTLRGSTQAGFNKQKLLRIDGSSVEYLAAGMFDASETRCLREALRQMSFNKARLIQGDLVSLMIAFDPAGTLRKAISEGFVITGIECTSNITTHFTDYMSKAMSEAGMIGEKAYSEVCDLYLDPSFRIGMVGRSTAPKEFADYLARSLPGLDLPLRIRFSEYSKEETVVEKLAAEILDRGSEFPFRKLIWDHYPDKTAGIKKGAHFDRMHCHDVATLDGEFIGVKDYWWKNRLNLDLVDEDEKIFLLVDLIEAHPGVKVNHVVFKNALSQSADEVLPLLQNLYDNQLKILIERNLLSREHLAYLPGRSRDMILGGDLGL